MKSSVFLQGLAAVCIAATASAVFGQNAIQLFSPANVRVSSDGTGTTFPSLTYNSADLSLTCATPITAKLSSSPSGSGNVLVDNYISLGISGGTPVNICTGGIFLEGIQNCFNTAYTDEASAGTLLGQDPDNLVASGGVPAIDISGSLKPGANQIQIGLVDTGSYLASSSLYLVTSCTQNGVSGPGNVTGNPISSTNPTSSQLTQNFVFNSTNSQEVGFTYDLSEAENSGQLSIIDETTPSVADTALDPAKFQSTYLKGTSFATATCLIHTGELYNNQPSCKLYTLTCRVGTDGSPSGVFCPVSQVPNEIFEDNFDGPPFTLPDLPGLHGGTFHTGVGFLEANEGWPGKTCLFDPASTIAGEFCPQNLLATFSGPGAYESGGRGQSTNSTFVTVAPVPEDLTTVNVTNLKNGNWINSNPFKVNFVSTPPAVASSNNFIAAPIQSLTYGISPASSVPPPGPPVPDDITLENSACPAPGQTNPPAAVPFTPSAQSISVPQDGKYALHYFAQDCAGTKELQFTQTAGSWSTSFYTYAINVDTVDPVLTGPTLPSGSTTYSIGQKVLATFRCQDALSGIAQCGTQTFSPAVKDTGNLTAAIDTSKAGGQTFTVAAVDAAGNTTKGSVNYTVTGAPASLVIIKLAPILAKQGSTFVYSITVDNFTPQTPATSVSITDKLPAGVSFVSASAGQRTNQASCAYAGTTVTCTTPSLASTSPVEVLVTVKATGAAGSTVTNVANVSSANSQGTVQSFPALTLITK